MSKQWQFIPSNPAGESSNPDARRIVRENAMRHFRRIERQGRVFEHARQRQGIGAAGAPPCAPAASQEHQGPDQGEDRRQESGKEMAELRVLSGGPGSALDPFCSTALPSDHDAPRLLQHFVGVIATQLQPGDVTLAGKTLYNCLVQAALEDKGAISSILFHASLHADSYRGGQWSPSTAYHFGQTIRLLNEKLGDEREAASDAALCMVGFLAGSGNITGDVTSDETHWRALQAMLDMRGGLHVLGWKGALAMILQTGGLIHATISGTPPRLNPPNLSTNQLATTLPQLLRAPPEACADDAAFIAAVHDMMALYRHLAGLQTTLFASADTSLDTVLSFTQVSIALEHLNLTLCPPAFYASPKTTLYATAHLALTLCTSFIFRNFVARSATFLSIQARLQPLLLSLEAALQNRNMRLERREHELLLWVLWVGAMAALQREWYMPRIEGTLTELGFGEWKEVSSVFGGFVWSPRMEGRDCIEVRDGVGLDVVLSSRRE